ncbi:hypothetical protein DFH07DRAFT_777564 [Mycena maculata]|uniref:Uncharacterized protein n=1 Tax=Mycena maculata TaxID=230809 RepID=A0AAD7IJQ4_9AGAR|nr:hypothetical protein DFH07DRAFT_777564 [Mycena maculata]
MLLTLVLGMNIIAAKIKPKPICLMPSDKRACVQLWHHTVGEASKSFVTLAFEYSFSDIPKPPDVPKTTDVPDTPGIPESPDVRIPQSFRIPQPARTRTPQTQMCRMQTHAPSVWKRPHILCSEFLGDATQEALGEEQEVAEQVGSIPEAQDQHSQHWYLN